MRPRLEASIIARLIVVVVFVIAAITLMAALRSLDETLREQPGLLMPNAAAGDPELIRCRDLGMAAAGDADCLAAWSDERRRFFGISDTPPSVLAAPLLAAGAEEEAVDTQAGGMEAP